MPATSVVLMVMVCGPSASAAVGVKVQFPCELTTAVPNGCPSLSRVIVAPISPVPLKVGRLSLVLPPSLIFPVTGPTSSCTEVSAGAAGAVVSTVKEKTGEFAETLPAASVALILMLYTPSARPVDGIKVQVPPTTTAVPISAPLFRM
ncbi:hypothetical protein D3C76_1065660 [compost metagenome]